MAMKDRIRVREVKTLSDDHYLLKKTTFDYRRGDGRWITQTRETYDRGDGCALLPYDAERGTVLLVRQFRYPVYVNGHPEPLIEACAGVLDGADPAAAMAKEAREELGYRLDQPRQVFEAYMSPGAVTERLTFFVAPYTAADRIDHGGGLESEGEDIEVLELPLKDALAMIDAGRICDAKTVMLLQYAALKGLISL